MHTYKCPYTLFIHMYINILDHFECNAFLQDLPPASTSEFIRGLHVIVEFSAFVPGFLFD
jgi:hypothetical protein